MSAIDCISTRVDPAIEAEAACVLAEMGMTVSEAYQMMLTRIIRDRRLPFRHEPNEETRKALQQIEHREELHYAKDADDLFAQLGI